MFIKISRTSFIIIIIFSIILNIMVFYLGLHLGELYKSMELEAKSLLPSDAKSRVKIQFSNYSAFKNISSIPEKVKLPEKNKIHIQVGAFKDISNAKKTSKKIEEMGFKTEIKEGRLNLLFVVSEGDEKKEKELRERLKKEGIKF
ncbi:MAG: SPOR domain-containing protein [Proteobacteria bacterium]|nr:SPOR domain-containing protein [Pseudomonadota bacterium]